MNILQFTSAFPYWIFILIVLIWVFQEAFKKKQITFESWLQNGKNNYEGCSTALHQSSSMLVRQFKISALPNAFISILVSLSLLIMPFSPFVIKMSNLYLCKICWFILGWSSTLLTVKSQFQSLEVFQKKILEINEYWSLWLFSLDINPLPATIFVCILHPHTVIESNCEKFIACMDK